MAYNDTLHKTELAFEAALAAVATAQSLDQRVALDADNKTAAQLTVISEQAEPPYENTANRFVTVAVSVRTNMDDTTPAQHRTKVKEVLDVLYDTEIAAALSDALDDFTCFHVEQLGETQTTVDRSHETTARFRCHVAPSDIS